MRHTNFSFLVLLFFFPVLLGGCSRPLRTLMALDAEQKQQHIYLVRKNRKFQQLLDQARQGRLSSGLSQSEVVARYGEPVLIREDGPSGAAETYLYRDEAAFFDTPKVYLDFDAERRLADVRIIEDGE